MWDTGEEEEEEEGEGKWWSNLNNWTGGLHVCVGGGGDMVDAHFKTLSNNLDPVKSNL